MEFKMVVFGEDKAALKLEESGAAAVDTISVMERILVDMFRVEEAVFSSQGRRGGGSWAGLKPETIKRKQSAVILVDTGELLRSVTESTDDMRVTNTSIDFATSHPGAASQQFGDSSRGLPARPFIRFTFYDLQRWESWITEHLTRTFND